MNTRPMKHLLTISTYTALLLGISTGCTPSNTTTEPSSLPAATAAATITAGEEKTTIAGISTADPQLRRTRGTDQYLFFPSKMHIRFGSTTYDLEEDIATTAIVGVGGKQEGELFKYTLNINAHPKSDMLSNCLNFRLSSQNKNLRDLTEGTYEMDYAQMQKNDLYWSISFAPDENRFYELESGALTLKKIRAQPEGGLLLSGEFQGAGGCFDFNGKLQKNTVFSGDFELYVQDKAIPQLLL